MNYTYLLLTAYLFSHCTIQGHLYHYIRFTFHFSPIAPQLRTTVPVASVQCRISSRHCTSPSSWKRPHTNSPSLQQMDKSGHGLWLDMIRPRQQGQEASQWACNLPLIEDSCCSSGPFQMLCSNLVWSGLVWSLQRAWRHTVIDDCLARSCQCGLWCGTISSSRAAAAAATSFESPGWQKYSSDATFNFPAKVDNLCCITRVFSQSRPKT